MGELMFGFLMVVRCGYDFHRVIDDGFAHLLQVVRGPGTAVGFALHRCIFGQHLGEVEQVGHVGQGFVDRDATVDAERGLIVVDGEGGEAGGFLIVEVRRFVHGEVLVYWLERPRLLNRVSRPGR